MNTIQKSIFPTSTEASKNVAKEISLLIKTNNNAGKQTILGLATGSTPLELYKELVNIHKNQGLSFRNVITFNLDEYYPMNPEDRNSYVHFMNKHLFDYIDIDKDNIHIPDGSVSEDNIDEYCETYEQTIRACGGIDIQLLGIGRSGHVGFNEPGSTRLTRTRLVKLGQITRNDAAPMFSGVEHVPKQAITMGIRSILDTKKIYLLAWGKSKAAIVKKALTDKVTDKIPATFLQEHKNTTVFLDKEAASELVQEQLT